MSRSVRFEDKLPLTPDEFSTPHHTDKANNPKGILLKEGTFEKNLKNGKASVPTSRRHKRHSTPAVEIAKMQNTVTQEPSHLRHDHRSRRRSFSGGLLDSHHHRHQFDAPSLHHRAQHDMARRDRTEPPSRPPLSPSRSQVFAVTPRHPYVSYTPQSRRDSMRWQGGDYYGFEAPYAATAAQHGAEITTWTGYPGTAVPQVPSGSMQPYWSSTTQSGTYYSPESQPVTRRLPEHLPKPSIKDVTVQRHLKDPRIIWNIAFPFSSSVFDSNSKLLLSELDSTATTPAIDKFTIKFDYSKAQDPIRALWTSIKIRGSYPFELDGATVFLVTIRDVLNAIFDFFQTPIAREEYAMLTNAEAQMVLHFQRRRAGRHPYGFGEPLRVDLLGDSTRFEGVRITSFKERRVYFGLELSRWS